MSIFPRRTRAGGTIVVHGRRGHRTSGEIEAASVGIVDPFGKERLVDRRDLLVLPKPAPARARGARRLVADAFRGTPAAVIAEYMSDFGEHPEYFLDFFRDLGSALNWYIPVPIRADAAPGRYHVKLETSLHGRLLRSAHQATDYFFVDEVTVLGMRRRRRQIELVLRNHSPEPTPMHLWAISSTRSGAIQTLHSDIMLAGDRVTALPVRATKCFLSYAQDTTPIGVNLAGEPFVRRDPRVLFQDHPERAQLCISAHRGRARATPLVLTGEIREVWLKVSGLRVRSELRTRRSAAAYDWLLERRLIIEQAA